MSGLKIWSEQSQKLTKDHWIAIIFVCVCVCVTEWRVQNITVQKCKLYMFAYAFYYWSLSSREKWKGSLPNFR